MNFYKAILFICLILSACTNPKKEKRNLENSESNAYIEQWGEKIASEKENYPIASDEDTITDINFQEFTASINRLIVFDEEDKLSEIQKDTVYLYAELGETIENQKIHINTQNPADFTIEQRYETSITISSDGEHFDLTDWKHYYSDWKVLRKENSNEFVCDSYSEGDSQKFPDTTIEELKELVKDKYSGWFDLISKNKNITESPVGIGISRYFFRITQKNGTQTVTKLIIIEVPMGC
jgi:hypothetical protein